MSSQSLKRKSGTALGTEVTKGPKGRHKETVRSSSRIGLDQKRPLAFTIQFVLQFFWLGEVV